MHDVAGCDTSADSHPIPPYNGVKADALANAPSMDGRPKNIGICLARIVFSFLVVCCHFFDGGTGESIVKSFRGMAVPVFFILSFYFTDRASQSAPDFNRHMRRRLSRILSPLWFWGSVLAPFYAATVLLSQTGPRRLPAVLLGIVEQLTVGHAYDPPLWFLFVLAVLTTSYGLGFKQTRPSKDRSAILLVLLFAAYWLQYSGVNYSLWRRLPFAFKFPIGRIAESIPFAVGGILLNRSKLLARPLDTRKTALCLAVSLVLAWPFPVLPWHQGQDFGYAGFFRLRAGIGLVLLFASSPMRYLPRQCLHGIEWLSSFSLGVFCIHVPVGFLVERILSTLHLPLPSIILCSLVYIASIALSAICIRFFGKRAAPFFQ